MKKKKKVQLSPQDIFPFIDGWKGRCLCACPHVCVYTVLELEFRTSEGKCIVHCHEKLDIQFILENIF